MCKAKKWTTHNFNDNLVDFAVGPRIQMVSYTKLSEFSRGVNLEIVSMAQIGFFAIY